MMLRMQRLLFLITIAAAGGESSGFAQSSDARTGLRPHFPGVQVTDIGPEGGSFLSLAADIRNPGVLYAGARNTGVFRTSDGGARWTKSGLAGRTVVALALDSNIPVSVYAAAGLDLGDSELGDVELFRSPDGGETWTRMFPEFPPDCVPFSLITHPRIPGALYLSACTSVFKSTDGGSTWNEVRNGLPASGTGASVGALAIDPQGSGAIYLVTHLCDQTGKLPPPACDNRIFTSDDGGDNWSEATASPLTASLGGALVADPQNPSVLYLHVTLSGGQNGVTKSIDRGRTWTKPTVYLSSGFGPQTLAIDPLDPNTLYASSLGMFKSVDGAQTWTSIYQPPVGFPALVVDSQTPGVVLGAGSFGIIRSADGGSTWTALTSGLHAIQILSVAVDLQHSGTLYAGDGNSSVYKTSNGGGTWEAAKLGQWYLTNALAVDPTDSNTIYVGTDVGVFKSIDGGNNWTTMNVGLAPPGQITEVNLLMIDPQHPNTVYAASLNRRGLFKSTDGAATWSTINSGLTLNGRPLPLLISALAMDSEDTSVLYAGTPLESSPVLKSKDGGLTWTALSPDLDSVAGKCCAWVSALAVDSKASGNVYAAIVTTSSGGAIWGTMDAGATWRNLFASSSVSVTALAIDPRDSSRIYAATTNGIMTSDDAGLNWRQIRGTPALISFLGFDPQNPAALYAAGAGGLFALDVGQESRLPFRR